eukprot:10431152-Alexandrium_andersonii.AAC.1
MHPSGVAGADVEELLGPCKSSSERLKQLCIFGEPSVKATSGLNSSLAEVEKGPKLGMEEAAAPAQARGAHSEAQGVPS